MTGISCHPDIEYAQIPGFRPRQGRRVVAWFPVTDLTSVHGPDDDDPHTREALVPGASHLWDGADDVPGLVARSADFAHSLAPLEV